MLWYRGRATSTTKGGRLDPDPAAEEPPRLTRPYVLANAERAGEAAAKPPEAPQIPPPTVERRAIVEPPLPEPRPSANRAVLLAAAIVLTLGIGAITAIAVGGARSPDTASAPPPDPPLTASYPPIPSTPPSLPPTVEPSSAPPATSAAPARSASASAPAKVVPLAAVSGPGCPQTNGHGFFMSGFASDWHFSDGGFTGDGCPARTVAVPMSGSATKDDNDNVVVWWFQGAPDSSCTVSVFAPSPTKALDSAGKPAHYLVFGTVDASGPRVGEFDVDQTANRGKWVTAGKFPMTGGRLSVRLVTRGIDFGSGRSGAHLGASALKLDC